jgi:hypothetical protein
MPIGPWASIAGSSARCERVEIESGDRYTLLIERAFG